MKKQLMLLTALFAIVISCSIQRPVSAQETKPDADGEELPKEKAYAKVTGFQFVCD